MWEAELAAPVLLHRPALKLKKNLQIIQLALILLLEASQPPLL